MALAADLLAIALAAVFLVVGLAKVLGADSLVIEFRRFGYPGWFRRLTGVSEVTGAALLLLGVAAADAVGLIGAVALVVVMLGAIATHVRTGDGADKLAPPTVLLILLGIEIALT